MVYCRVILMAKCSRASLVLSWKDFDSTAVSVPTVVSRFDSYCCSMYHFMHCSKKIWGFFSIFISFLSPLLSTFSKTNSTLRLHLGLSYYKTMLNSIAMFIATKLSKAEKITVNGARSLQ